MFNKSTLIVAHPDDDILWFSSIIEKVDSILFCFSDYPPNPDMGKSRKKTVAEYPLKNVSSLELVEPQSFDKGDWEKPMSSSYGIEFIKNKNAESRYKNTFDELVEILKNKLVDIDNVFTHNPWGEYGHEDHILVYRAIKQLQSVYHFNIWYSNYCSNRSFNLMLQYISGFNSEYITLPTNITLAEEITQIYKKNGCWTWYEDYQWFKEECLIQDADINEPLRYGHIFPVNIIKMHFEKKIIKPKKNMLHRNMDKVKNIFG